MSNTHINDIRHISIRSPTTVERFYVTDSFMREYVPHFDIFSKELRDINRRNEDDDKSTENDDSASNQYYDNI